MNEKKRPMGFKTPAQEMHEALEEIKGLLQKEKANWVEIRRSSMTKAAEITTETEKMMAEGKDVMTIMFRSNWVMYLGLMMTIAKLGEELATTHQRLANVEKSITELNRRIK